MIIKVLGSAAGGGFPQWNCACPNCTRLRAGDPSVSARTNDSLAISPDGIRWALLNASPDICLQSDAASSLHPGPSLRGSPIQTVLLTDSELDHTTGLLQLRQGSSIEVYAPPPVLFALADDFPVRRILEPFASFRWRETIPEESFPLFGGQLSVCPFYLSDKPPRYIRAPLPWDPEREREREPWVIGYRISDRETGGVAVYAPGIESWSPTLERHLADADCLLLDGTFWQADELRALGVSELDAYDMGHLPVSGTNGSAGLLARLPARRKIYIHINNTNPMLVEHSPERRSLTALGIEVGFDGMELEV
ncbi:pyrroloquinoline quinone biosynthesis protein PqqB [Paenibacillus rhizovicinus]|uniref:Coenzyme PQQ synthesis protein B n=1 Tax=Paenibacillus rhizovicinus TaxID=2704463 RepID=A0A6C0NTT8_9BACL|nr:pyrroloquinoline quinone biosynthesis protein PqqB [Paenibacillus rhizovicinus]QHW29585.1 pyrroloquinoline quinone biosynthesis protein PqqB [Paenibacillus rhizovicinus]